MTAAPRNHLLHRHVLTAAVLSVALAMACSPAAHAGAYATEWSQLIAHSTQLEQFGKQIQIVENTLQSAEDEAQELTQLPGNLTQQVVGGPMSIIDSADGLYQQLSGLQQNIRDVSDSLDVAAQVGQQFQITPSEYYSDEALAAQQMGGQFKRNFDRTKSIIESLPKRLAAVKNEVNSNQNIKSQVAGAQAMADAAGGVEASMTDLSGAIVQQQKLIDEYDEFKADQTAKEESDAGTRVKEAEQVAEAAQKATFRLPNPASLAQESYESLGGTQ